MKKLLLIFFLLAGVSWGDAGFIGETSVENPTSGGDIEYGTAAIGSSTSLSPNGRWEPFTVAAAGVTISHGAVYCSSSGSSTIQMAIFDDSGTPVIEGVCSNASASFGGVPAWNAVTWGTPVVLSAGDYWMRYVIATGSNVTYYYDDDAGATRRYGPATSDCTDEAYTATSTRIPSMVVANYASKP